jgi:hypothetical protein
MSRLWTETAYQSLIRAGDELSKDVVRTFQTEDLFVAVLASGLQGGAEGHAEAATAAERATSMMKAGTSLDEVARGLISAQEVSFSLLRILGGAQARLLECEMPPLVMIRGGEVEFLPLREEAFQGRLVREGQFALQDGDYLVMVSEGYIRVSGWDRRWGWGDIAISTRRWTDTRCDADELLGALIGIYRRFAQEELRQDVTVVVMRARPMRSATVWTGPPADPTLDSVALSRLVAENGTRIICGDTTAQIAARLLGAELEIERRPPEGWEEVPPLARLEGVDLVTEGVVTLGKTLERLKDVRSIRDIPRGEDGATQLARRLLRADKIHFVIGQAVNPLQVVDVERGFSKRQLVAEELIRELRARGKLVSVEVL